MRPKAAGYLSRNRRGHPALVHRDAVSTALRGPQECGENNTNMCHRRTAQCFLTACSGRYLSCGQAAATDVAPITQHRERGSRCTSARAIATARAAPQCRSSTAGGALLQSGTFNGASWTRRVGASNCTRQSTRTPVRRLQQAGAQNSA